MTMFDRRGQVGEVFTASRESDGEQLTFAPLLSGESTTKKTAAPDRLKSSAGSNR